MTNIFLTPTGYNPAGVALLYCTFKNTSVLTIIYKKTPESTDKNEFWIVIENMDNFIKAIVDDLRKAEKNRLFHQVSWLNKNELLRKANNIIPTVRNIKHQPSNEPLKIELYSIYGRDIEYYDEKQAVKTLSPEATSRASNKRKEFSGEQEYRIEFNPTSFLTMDGTNPDPSLHNLVEYLKIKCPNINNYCRAI